MNQHNKTKILQIARRDFLRTSVVASTVVVTGAVATEKTNASETSVEHRPSQSARSGFDLEFELEETTINRLSERMKSGELTSRAIVGKYLERIEKTDKAGPAINSIIELNPDALRIADLLDVERRAKGARGPLHGIPVLIKDNIDTADKMMTTAGSLALEGSIAARDSFVAQRLREAGAVILGKTNLSEWANFRSSRSSSGWSGRGGQTRNPYVLDRNPCGSSSGSGAATSANLCVAAVGTETNGSIVCPSSINSLVGIKPTLGLISRAGIIPIAHSQDTAGPMARTLTDAAILLTALAGVDPRDEATAALNKQEKTSLDYTKFLDPNGLRGARIGVSRKHFGFNPHVDKLINDALDEMKRQGAVIIDTTDLPTGSQFGSSTLEVLLFEFKADLNKYLGGLGPSARVHSLKDIIDFNEKNREKEMPFFGQETMERSEAKGPLTSKEYLDALAKNRRLAGSEGIDAVMTKMNLNALVAPTGAPAWPIDLINGDHFVGSGVSTLPAVTGYPHITVPAGYVFGLPVGLSFFGRAFSEPTLIKLAYGFEQISKARKPPRFLPSI